MECISIILLLLITQFVIQKRAIRLQQHRQREEWQKEQERERERERENMLIAKQVKKPPTNKTQKMPENHT